jgi:hypothetical protein
VALSLLIFPTTAVTALTIHPKAELEKTLMIERITVSISCDPLWSYFAASPNQ